MGFDGEYGKLVIGDTITTTTCTCIYTTRNCLKPNFTNFEPENRPKIALSTTFRSNKKQIPKSDAVKLYATDYIYSDHRENAPDRDVADVFEQKTPPAEIELNTPR